MDRLAAMQVFVKVAELASFSEAAQALDQSKSTVSKHVAWLEEQLGTRLLNRTTRRLSLTEAGTGYLERCRQILTDVAEAESAISAHAATPRGLLKIASPMSFGFLHLAPVLPDFLERYPDIAVDLAMNDRYVDLIDEGYDVAVRIGGMPDSSLIARRVARSALVTLAAPRYLDRHGAPTHPSALADRACLIYRWPQPQDIWRYETPDGDTVDVKVSGPVQANNADALKAAAVGGLGILTLPLFLATDALQSGTLVPILTDYRLPSRDLHAVYPHNRHLSAKVRVFVDFLVETFGNRQDWLECRPDRAAE